MHRICRLWPIKVDFLLPHQKHQNYHYRRQSLYDNMQHRVSLTHLVMRRLSRTSDYTNGGMFHSVANVIPANSPNGNV
ncbi:unnamed protein product [Rotaria sp. Silwood2]|nr:unnamed protein product [Rotaria sp. Silwood2]